MNTVISIQAGSEPRKQAVMHESQEYWFGHEKLDVYREAIDFPGKRGCEELSACSSD